MTSFTQCHRLLVGSREELLSILAAVLAVVAVKTENELDVMDELTELWCLPA